MGAKKHPYRRHELSDGAILRDDIVDAAALAAMRAAHGPLTDLYHALESSIVDAVIEGDVDLAVMRAWRYGPVAALVTELEMTEGVLDLTEMRGG